MSALITAGGKLYGVDRPKLVWSHDFRLDSTFDLKSAGDTRVLWDGVTLRLDNKANANVFSITNGTGLQMSVSAGTNRLYNGGAGTAPAFWLDLDGSDLPAILKEYGRAVTVWVRLSALSLPQAANQFLVGMKQGLDLAGAANGMTHQSSGGGWINDAGVVKPTNQRTSAWAHTFRTELWTPTLMLVGAARFSGIQSGTHDSWVALVSDFPSGFPDDVSDSRIHMASRDSTSANTQAGFNSYRGKHNRAVWALCTGSASGAPSCTVEEIGLGIGVAA